MGTCAIWAELAADGRKCRGCEAQSDVLYDRLPDAPRTRLFTIARVALPAAIRVLRAASRIVPCSMSDRVHARAEGAMRPR
jgi:hypothetical protein